MRKAITISVIYERYKAVVTLRYIGVLSMNVTVIVPKDEDKIKLSMVYDSVLMNASV